MTRKEVKELPAFFLKCQRCDKVRFHEKWIKLTDEDKKELLTREVKVLTTLCVSCGGN